MKLNTIQPSEGAKRGRPGGEDAVGIEQGDVGPAHDAQVDAEQAGGDEDRGQ